MIEQIGIAVFGLTAVFLTQCVSFSFRRWAPILGMISQPFWIYAAIDAQQGGILICNMAYTVIWGMGIYNNWFSRVRPA